MKDWLNQSSTKLGIGSAVIAVIGVLVANGQLDPAWTVAISAGLSAFGLRMNDNGPPSPPSQGRGTPKAPGLLTLALLLAGCGASLADIPIDDDTKVEIAIEAGCAAAASADCFEDADVQDLFGKLKTSDQCVAAAKEFVATEKISVDLVKLTGKIMTCKRFVDAFLNY